MTFRVATFRKRKICRPFLEKTPTEYRKIKFATTIGFFIASTMVFQRTAAMPSSLLRDAKDKDGFVFPANDEEKTIKRETSPAEIAAQRTGDIVFPNEETDSQSKNFTPGPAPECRTKTYCEKTAFYPENYVSNVIKNNEDLKFFAGVDVVGDVAQRIHGDDSTALCASEERLIYPTAAQNRNNNWLFVVNQEQFKQGVRIETCLSPEGECSVISGFADGYRTMCKQKYILRQLAAISQNGTAIRDMFKLPSSCCCHVKIESPYNRMGISLQSVTNNQSPVSGARRRRKVSKSD